MRSLSFESRRTLSDLQMVTFMKEIGLVINETAMEFRLNWMA